MLEEVLTREELLRMAGLLGTAGMCPPGRCPDCDQIRAGIAGNDAELIEAIRQADQVARAWRALPRLRRAYRQRRRMRRW